MRIHLLLSNEHKPLTAPARPTLRGYRAVGLLAAAVLCGPALFGGQSLNLTGVTGSYNVPNRMPFTALGNFRVELRIHGFGGCSSQGYTRIWDFGALDLICADPGSRYLFFRDGPAGVAALIDLSQYSTDVVLRLQRDISSGALHAEWWSIDGARRASTDRSPASTTTVNIGGRTLAFGDPNTAVTLAWVRWYSTLAPVGGPIPANTPAGGNLADWEFEGNGTDSGPNGLNATIGAAVYVPTPAYAPVAAPQVLGANAGTPDVTARAGFPATLDGSGSYSLIDSPALRYFWSQLDGRTQLHWSDRTIAQPVVTGLVFGEYKVRLTVTDASQQTASADLTLGAVATDDNGVVIYPDSKLDYLFGPVMRFGVNPWSWADVNQRNLSIVFGENLTRDPGYQAQWQDRLAGTVTTLSGSATVTGAGTNFMVDFCQGGATPATNAQIVTYSSDGGKIASDVNSCQSATQLTLQGAAQVSLSAVPYAKMEGAVPVNWGWAWNGIGGATNANYYDNVLAHYNLYYRTGLTKYRDYARKLAARWLDSPWFGQSPYPRMWALNGLILNTWEQGNLAQWAQLEPILDRAASHQSTPGTVSDIREEGYEIAYLATGATFQPNAGKAAVYAQAIQTAKTARWQPSRNSGGYQETDLCGWAWDCNAYDQLNWQAVLTQGSRMVSAPAESGTLSVTSGSTQVVGVGSSLKTRLCRGGSTPPHLNGMANERIVFWLGSQQYPVGLVASCQDETHVTLSAAYSGPTQSGLSWSLSWPYWDTPLYWYTPTDTIHLTSGSTTATFSLADIQSRSCNGSGSTTPDFYSALVIRIDPAKDQKFAVVEVAACNSSSQLTMKSAWTGSSGDYRYMQPTTNIWFMNNAATVGYQLSFLDPVNAILDRPYEAPSGTSSWRFGGGPTVQPFIEGVATTAWAWASRVTGDAGTRAWVTENVSYIRDFGYWPALKGYYYFSSGPGCGDPNPAYYLWCSGGSKAGDLQSIAGSRFLVGETIKGFSEAYLIGGDASTKARMDTLYSACLGRPGYGGNLDPYFCGELLEVESGGKAKDFGFFYGMGNAASWPAARLGGVRPAALVPMHLNFRLNSVPGAVAVRATLTTPAGGVWQVLCTSRPCSITLDQRQGSEVWVQMDYLDSQSRVRASGERVLLHTRSPAN